MTNALRDELFNEVIRNLVQVLRRAGISDAQLYDAIGLALRNPDTTNPSVSEDQALEPRSVELLANLVALWRRDDRFADELGEPRVLPAQGGDPSIKDLYQLAAQKYPAAARALLFDEVLRRLIDHQVIERTEQGHYRLISLRFSVNTASTRAGLLNLEYLTDFMATSITNLDSGGSAGLFQRRASTSRFPVSSLPLLKNMLEEQGMQLLSQIDNFIEHESDNNASTDVTPVQIGLFMSHRKKERPLD